LPVAEKVEALGAKGGEGGECAEKSEKDEGTGFRGENIAGFGELRQCPDEQTANEINDQRAERKVCDFLPALNEIAEGVACDCAKKSPYTDKKKITHLLSSPVFLFYAGVISLWAVNGELHHQCKTWRILLDMGLRGKGYLRSER